MTGDEQPAGETGQVLAHHRGGGEEPGEGPPAPRRDLAGRFARRRRIDLVESLQELVREIGLRCGRR
ncbi:MAG: hypothetical protein R2862_11500 [Thermoanaerobaculia bacterium]